MEPGTRSAATPTPSSRSCVGSCWKPEMPSWLAHVNPSKAQVQLGQPLPLLSTKCLVNLWSGSWLSPLSTFSVLQCSFYLSLCERKRMCVPVSLQVSDTIFFLNSIIRFLLKPHGILQPSCVIKLNLQNSKPPGKKGIRDTKSTAQNW